MFFLRRNVSASIPFFMPDDVDPWSGKTGLTSITVQYWVPSQGSFNTITSPTISEIGNGWYVLSLPASYLAEFGPMVLRFTATGAKPQQQLYQVIGFDPYDQNGLGLAYLDATVSSAAATDWTASEREQIRYALGIDGAQTAPTGNTGWIPQIYSKVSPLQFTGGNVNALVNAYATGLDPATLVWGASTKTLTALGDSLVDEIWNRSRSASPRPTGSFGDLLDVKVSSVQSPPTWTDSEKEQIRYRLSIDGAQTAPTTTSGTMHAIHAKVSPLQFNAGNVLAQVAAYSNGQTPADYILVDTAKKILADANGYVTVAANNDKSGYTLTSAEKDSIVDLVWDEPKSAHTVAGSFGDYLDAKITSRHPNAAVTVGGYQVGQDPGSHVWNFSVRTLTSVLNVVSGTSTTIADQIWNRLRSDDTRPTGSFGYYLDATVSSADDPTVTDWTPEEREQIRYVLGIDGTKTAPTANTGWIPDIKGKTDQLAFTGGNVHAVVASYFSGMSPAEQILMNTAHRLLTNSSGHVTVATNNDKSGYSLSTASVGAIADAVWDEPKSGHTTQDTFGDYLDVKVSSRHPNANVTVGGYASGQSPAEQVLREGNRIHVNASGYLVAYSVLDKSGYALTPAERDLIVDAVWDEPKVAHSNPNSFGDYLDVKVSSRHPNTSVTVGGYDVGKSPQELILSNPTAKLNNTTNGGVFVGGYEAGLSPSEMLLMDSSRKLFLTSAGGVRVGEYESGQSPADSVLMNPNWKLTTNNQGEVTVSVNRDKANYALSSSEYQNIASAVWNFVVESAYSAIAILRMVSSVLFGKRIVSGNNFRYRDLHDTKDRVVGQVDLNKNREIDSLDGS